MAIRIRALAAGGLLLAAVPAAANNVWWSTPGSGCVPFAGTTAGNHHASTALSVQHSTTSTAAIGFTCPVSRFNVGGNQFVLNMVYQDSTGVGTSAFVQARLYRVPVGATSPASIVATLNSNSSGSTTTNKLTTPTFTHSFNFDTHIYWVRIDIDRAVVSEIAILHSVSIEQII